MALVAVALLGAKGAGGGPVAALVLPTVETAVHGHHPVVAQFGEGYRGKCRTDPPGAHGHHRLLVVDNPILDVALQVAPGDMQGARDRSLLVLVGFTYVEQQPAVGQQSLSAGRCDLVDVGPRLG